MRYEFGQNAHRQHHGRIPLEDPRLPQEIMGRRWHIFRANPRGEFHARADLLSRDVECYVPVETTWRERRRRKVRHHASLFGNYGFFGLATGQPLATVRGTDGLEKVLRDEMTGRVMVVPPEMIEGIVHRESIGSFDKTREPPSAAFAPGSSVTITDPRFDGLEGIVDRPSSDDRVRVLLAVLGAVDIDVAQLRRV